MDTIHLVSHTHWDREWYLTFQQFRLKLVHLVDRLLDILANDPEFKFFLLDGQTIILEDYLQIRPEREPDLARFIRNGRLLIGPWYVSPDEYLIAPESHIRNLLEGDKLCQKYGGKMLVGYLPDTFGHIGQMPQILRGFAIDTACVWRGLDDQPCELTWKASDGSQVLLSYLRDSYSNAASLTISDPDLFIKDIKDRITSLANHSATGQILLMHGTDHMEPPAGLSGAIVTYQQNTGLNNLVHSSLPRYFDSVRSLLSSSGDQVPAITGELRSSKHTAILQNVLSTRIWLKQRNHYCENELLKWIEPISAWISLIYAFQIAHASANSNVSHEILENQNSIIHYAWKLLMQCHPHDSICGTSIDQVANEMRVRFDQVDQINHELVNQCLQTISDQIDTRFTNSPNLTYDRQNILTSITVFNPNDSPQTGLINLNIALDNKDSLFNIVDDQGNVIPYDQIGMGARELITMTLDKKSLKQALGMIHEGAVAGMMIRNFDIDRQEQRAIIRTTLSDRRAADVNKWKRGVAQLELLIADPGVTEYIIHAYSDPEIDLSFIARDVLGHGYRTYWIQGYSEQSLSGSQQIKLNPVTKNLLPLIGLVTRNPLFSRLLAGKKHKSANSNHKIENEYFMVEVIPSLSAISITDKTTHQNYTGLHRFVNNADCGDLYNYCPPENDLVITSKIKKVEYEGHITCQKLIIYSELKIPTRISLDRKSRSHERKSNRIKSTLTVVPGVARIDIHTEIENLASDHRVRVHFPTPFITSYSLQDGHFEIVQRQIGIPDYDESWEEPPRPEIPECQFTCVKNDYLSLTIANRGLPEVEVFKNESGNTEIAITLLRCVGWLSRDDLKTRKGHAGPMGIATPEAQMIGKYDFDYSIIPGDNNWRNSIKQAYSFNAPLKSITTPIHSGTLPSNGSLVENHNQNFIITTIKQAEANSGLIVRGFNILPSPIDVSLTPWRSFNHAQLVSLDEKPIELIPITPRGSIDLQIDGNKIVTIRFTD